jgi:hypothetical protein
MILILIANNLWCKSRNALGCIYRPVMRNITAQMLVLKTSVTIDKKLMEC